MLLVAPRRHSAGSAGDQRIKKAKPQHIVALLQLNYS